MTEFLILTSVDVDGHAEFMLHTQMANVSESAAMAEARRISSALGVATLLATGTVTLVTPESEVDRG